MNYFLAVNDRQLGTCLRMLISYNIPVEFQKWHLNRLLTLIRVCNVKNSPPKRRSKREMWNRNAAINAANRKRFGSKG